MMKLLAILLSIYILALNLTPCEDEVVIATEIKTEVLEIGHEDAAHQHEEGADLCSPFCICQCCHINAMVSYKPTPIKFIRTYMSTEDFFYIKSTGKDFTTSILQPPRA